MVGLLDIAPVTDKVMGVNVYGVSALGVVHLLRKFPEIRMMMTGREVTAERLMELAPEAIAAIIAAGTGSPGDEATERRASELGLEVQLDFIDKILALTMPSGVGPFAEKLARLGAFSGEFGKVAGTNSPLQSNSLSQTDIGGPKSGGTLPDK